MYVVLEIKLVDIGGCMQLSHSAQCDIAQRDTHWGQNRDQKPWIDIPSALGKAAQKAAQRSISASSPPWSSGAEIISK